MKIFWLDLETTGLDPQRDSILELAIAEADLQQPFEIGPVMGDVFRYVGGMIEVHPSVREMHTKNGLWDECARSERLIVDVEEYLLGLIPDVADRDDRPTLAGRSVHFDLGFLRVHMPRVAARLSHRVLDVSAVELFCRSQGMSKLPKALGHRAKDDVLESMEHLRRCKAWLEKSVGG